MTKLKRHIVLPLVAGIAMTIVLLLPQTSWLARPQLPAALGVWSQSDILGMTGLNLSPEDMPLTWLRYPRLDTQALAMQKAGVLRTHPQDIETQIAGTASEIQESEENTDALRHLVKQCPHAPEIYASILRYAVSDEASLSRRSERDILLDRPSMHYFSPQKPEEIIATKRFILEARQGEKLDPQNAYFPLMRSIGLFSLRQDDKAIQAFHKAAQCPRFQDYTREENLANLKLHDEALGKQRAIGQFFCATSSSYKHYRSIHSLAELVVALAVQRDIMHNIKDGMALRRDLITLAQKIQRDTSSVPVYLTGASCEAIAYYRPNGLLFIHYSSDDENDKNISKYQQKIREYRYSKWDQYALVNHAEDLVGRPKILQAEKNYAQQEINVGVNHSLFDGSLWLATCLENLFSSSLLLLSLLILFAGGIGWVFLRFTRLKDNQAAHVAVSWGVGLGLLISVAWVIGAMCFSELRLICILPLGVFIIAFGIGSWRLRKVSGSKWQQFGMLILSLITPMGIAYALLWVMVPGLVLPYSIISMFQCLCDLTEPDPSHPVLIYPVLPIIAVGIVWSSPVLLTLFFMLLSKKRKIPVTLGVTWCIVRYAVPIASVSLLLFALTMPLRVCREDKLRADIRAITQNERAFYHQIAQKALCVFRPIARRDFR
jgi:hypothetical protein